MSHQTVTKYLPDEEEHVEVPADDYPVVRSWDIEHWGGSDADAWVQAGDITIRDIDGPWGGPYLECRVKDQPFFSIKAAIDQWGTWYEMKLSGGGVVRAEAEAGTVTYAQEWGCKSFIRALGEALIVFAGQAEPPWSADAIESPQPDDNTLN